MRPGSGVLVDRRSPGQQETFARGQAEEQAGHFQLEVRQIRHTAPSPGSASGIYAAMP
jgi:hypothetical protein